VTAGFKTIIAAVPLCLAGKGQLESMDSKGNKTPGKKEKPRATKGDDPRQKKQEKPAGGERGNTKKKQKKLLNDFWGETSPSSPNLFSVLP